jgi:hypothetical protein
MTPQRPMLGAVLDALTAVRDHRRYDATPSVLLRTGATRVTASAAGVDVWVRDEYGWSFSWATTDPAEAWEILQARDLIPLDCRSRFVCEDCSGRGDVEVPELGKGWHAACPVCLGDGHRPHPPTVAALAAWASVGFAATDDGHPGIVGAEELARELGGLAVVWRVAELKTDPALWEPQSAVHRLAAAGLGITWSPHLKLYVPPLT